MNLTAQQIEEVLFDTTDAEELEFARECADKIKGHLNRLITQESKIKYVNNMEILNNVLKSCNEPAAIAV